MKKSIFAAALLVQSFAFAGEKIAQCSSDFSVINQGKKTIINVLLEQNGSKVKSTITGTTVDETTNEDVAVRTMQIRAGFDPSADLSEDVLAALNEGERALVHIETLKRYPEAAVNIPFSTKDVASVKIYDLDGQSLTNMFGGTVLIEASGKDGQLLGRVFRSILANGCF